MELLYYLAIKPWHELLTREIAITGHGYAAQIVISPWPETQSRLQVKHGILALFWASDNQGARWSGPVVQTPWTGPGPFIKTLGLVRTNGPLNGPGSSGALVTM